MLLIYFFMEHGQLLAMFFLFIIQPHPSYLMQKYQILSPIGEGAYGVVLKCRDQHSQSFVAIKKFKQTEEEAETKKTTIREVKLLKLAVHPNIVQLKEAFWKKGTAYLVFQFVQNNLLEVLEKSPNGLPLSSIRSLIFQLLQGLAYLHQLNIVHRDIKPENLLVSSDQRLKVCDFGFARQITVENRQVLTDYVATRWYRPPELLVGCQYNKQIDLWATGCIMCELIDGNPLFPGQNQLDQLFLIQKTLGTLPLRLYQSFLRNERFFGIKFPQMHSLDSLQKMYVGKICPKGLSLIKSLLKIDPKQRISAVQALNHPFFQEQRLGETMSSKTDRKGAQSTIANKKQIYAPIDTNRSSKLGRIYNPKEKDNHLHQFSFNSKTTNLTSKTFRKSQKNNEQPSLQKYRKMHIPIKTQARGLYFDSTEEKLNGFGDFSKKSTEIGSIPSSQQLPFAIYSQQMRNKSKLPKGVSYTKKKNQISQRQTFNIKQLLSHK